jgi:hypothetical protein
MQHTDALCRDLRFLSGGFAPSRSTKTGGHRLERQSTLQFACNGGKFGSQICADQRNRRDDRNGDKRSDQTIFDGCDARPGLDRSAAGEEMHETAHDFLLEMNSVF